MKPWLKATEWLKGQQWLRKKQTWALVGFVVLALCAVGFAFARQIEHRKRLTAEHQLSQTIQAKQLVEAKLSAEARRSQKLAEALEVKTNEVDQVVKRLEEEANAVALLQGRLAATESQVSQLQAELVLSARAREELAQRMPAQAGGGPTELEKIHVVVGPLGGLHEASGKIIQVNPDWQFVVVDLGWHTVNIGDVLGIYRGEQLIAKVKVERVQEQVAAASILPEYRTAEVAVNDRVAVL
ncbi:MAG: hypothetical protein HYZ89_06740 [Candidatus Omnitrophica bacterium]|nr:hypothetical protein [Candidatus Omnitrophota bacterium]